MKSFFFWLVTAAALGTLVGTYIGPSWLEILIVWGVLLWLFYGVRSWRSARRSARQSLEG